MANLNKVMLIGRLTRDPEVRTFSTGGKVARFGFAVNNRRKNQQPSLESLAGEVHHASRRFFGTPVSTPR